MLVFNKIKYLKRVGGYYDGLADQQWVEECDGEKVTFSNFGKTRLKCIGKETGICYEILREWCERI